MNNIVYQVYPKSFADSNGDGVGDIKGVQSHLDHIKALGVDTVWLSPIFCSPMVDNGYDISDYRDVDPCFGTLEELDALFAAAKARGMGVLLDLVLNHTSDRHPWFQAALADPHSKYRDYYIFRKGKDGGPPNNWRSNFGGSAWELDAGTGEYYLHVFAKEQPDLNWENPALRAELFDMICWWMKRGAAGFRVDAICFIKKDQRFPSLPADGPDGLADPGAHWQVCEGIGAFLGEMRDKAFRPHGAYTVAEANGVPYERLGEYIGPNGYFSAVFDFSYTDIDIPDGAWHAAQAIDRTALRAAIFHSQTMVSRAGHGAVYLENHDQNRCPNKYLSPEERGYAGITMLGALYFFLQGTAYIYQGQELGMTNFPWAALEQFDDVATVNQYHRTIEADCSADEALAVVAHRSRDNARTPIPWTEEPDGGFTTGAPWLPVHPGYKALCAAAQARDEGSVLRFYQRMGALRSGPLAPLFYDGDFLPLWEDVDGIFAYQRALAGTRVLVVCNFQNTAATLRLPACRALLGNLRPTGECLSGQTALAPFEALVLEVEG